MGLPFRFYPTFQVSVKQHRVQRHVRPVRRLRILRALGRHLEVREQQHHVEEVDAGARQGEDQRRRHARPQKLLRPRLVRGIQSHTLTLKTK